MARKNPRAAGSEAHRKINDPDPRGCPVRVVFRGHFGGGEFTTAVLDADYLHDRLGWLAGVMMTVMFVIIRAMVAEGSDQGLHPCHGRGDPPTRRDRLPALAGLPSTHHVMGDDYGWPL